MNFRVLQSHRLDCIFVRAFGRHRTEDIILFIQQLHRLELFHSGAPVVADVRFVDFDVPIETLALSGRVPVLPPKRTERRVAFVAGCELGFGMLRAMAALRDRDRQANDVFWTFRDAFEWIGRPEFGEALSPEIDRMLDEQLDDACQHDRFSIQISHV